MQKHTLKTRDLYLKQMIAFQDTEKYIQVTENMNSPETRERELAPLQKIRDNFEKSVIALDCDLIQTQDGIKVVKALDFLLE